MTRSRTTSPTLALKITPEQHERAVQSMSGGCLVADAIKEQYPHLTGITVDMATIRVSDRKAGLRYTYLSPPAAQHLLLAYDQGWPQPTQDLVIKRAVKVTPISRSKGHAAARELRREELESKAASGEALTVGEKSALKRMRDSPTRPTSRGPSVVHVDEKNASVTVHGGTPIPQGKAHPNLLRGRDRHFGAKLANPGQAFAEAVDAAVAERMTSPESTPSAK